MWELLREKEQYSLLQLGRGMIGPFGCTVSLPLSLFRLDDGVALLVPCSIMVTESPCWCWYSVKLFASVRGISEHTWAIHELIAVRAALCSSSVTFLLCNLSKVNTLGLRLRIWQMRMVITIPTLFWKMNEWMHMKCLEYYLVYSSVLSLAKRQPPQW